MAPVIEEALTTTEAATLAGVAGSTIKRWADEGLLPFTRTAGGHRRFERTAIEAYLGAQRAISQGADPTIDEWVRRLVAGERYDVDSRAFEARARLGAWSRVADEIGQVLEELGRRWEAGELSIGEEHVASEALRRSLARIGDAMPVRQGGRQPVLLCAEDDDHTLGLALAELCLREAGHSPLWLGRRTPVAEVARLVEDGRVSLVAVSASGAAPDPGVLARMAADLAEVCRPHDVPLIVGGRGAWPDLLPYGVRLASFEAFHQHLVTQGLAS